MKKRTERQRPVPVVMRSRNDIDYIQATLEQLTTQSIPYELIVFDNDSTDGTREIVQEYAHQVHRVPDGTYVPGKVLNRAMEAAGAEAEFVVFLNSDCTPLNSSWLEELLEGFRVDPAVGAVFGRQVPRPDCLPLFAKDTEDTFGDGSRQQYWRHCFSMASSAVRRSCWEQQPFNEAIQYSEDIEWTWQARQRGWLVQYQAKSAVYHSHNYTLKQYYRRQRGEGKAEAVIFPWSRWERSWLRYSLLPLLRQLKSDFAYALCSRKPAVLLHSPALRIAQMLGRRRGFKEGVTDAAEQKR